MTLIEALQKLPLYDELKELTVNKYINGDSPTTSEILNFIKKHGVIGHEVFKAPISIGFLYCFICSFRNTSNSFVG